MSNEKNSWVSCANCQGRGKKSRRLRKKVKLQYQRELDAFEKANREGIEPERPKGHLEICVNCKGSGLEYAKAFPLPDTKNYPHIAIVGGGIGGVALAVACLHRGIPFTLFERDSCFDERSQGYGLTLQQASRAINGLGILSLKDGVVSTRHVVHTTDGKMIGEWGIRKWGAHNDNESPKRTNIHIARQSLRLSLIEQLGGHDVVQWNHQLIDFNDAESHGLDLSFKVGDKTKQIHADLMVGADGIRSSVRRLLIGEEASPLRYLGCIAILGICPLSEIEVGDRTLLDSATVFQTANGHERIYIMPFTADSVMWQLSFPMDETDAKALSAKGVEALKEEAIRRCDWHDPIPQLLTATQSAQISGYPVYDRALLKSSMLEQGANITLIGDAAHPMSPFKGQGANQALLDALALARGIAHGCRSFSKWREVGLRKSVLTDFEKNMLERSATKVQDSADAADFLHSKTVLHEGNEPRGRCLKRGDEN